MLSQTLYKFNRSAVCQQSLKQLGVTRILLFAIDKYTIIVKLRISYTLPLQIHIDIVYIPVLFPVWLVTTYNPMN